MPKHLTKKKQGAVNRSLFLNFIQLFIQQGNRQSDHVKVVALDLPDKQRTLALNSVSACFVRRLARGDVFLDLRVAKFITAAKWDVFLLGGCYFVNTFCYLVTAFKTSNQ